MTMRASVSTELSAANYGTEPPKAGLSTQVLRRQNLAFKGTGGVSTDNCSQGFVPAFLDTDTGSIYLARFADGRPAPMHLLDGLPSELIISRDATGRCQAVKHSLIAGFVQAGRFYTREQAACCV